MFQKFVLKFVSILYKLNCVRAPCRKYFLSASVCKCTIYVREHGREISLKKSIWIPVWYNICFWQDWTSLPHFLSSVTPPRCGTISIPVRRTTSCKFIPCSFNSAAFKFPRPQAEKKAILKPTKAR